jgi:hypothetical protein
MKTYVGELNQVVTGGEAKGNGDRPAGRAARPQHSKAPNKMLPPPAKKKAETAGKNPAREIPLGDDDFRDF